jgi:hypothetical protein
MSRWVAPLAEARLQASGGRRQASAAEAFGRSFRGLPPAACLLPPGCYHREDASKSPPPLAPGAGPPPRRLFRLPGPSRAITVHFVVPDYSAMWQSMQGKEARFKGENRTYTEKAAFSNCFNLFASNSCSRRFFVIAMARWISSRASESLPIFISRSPRTLGKRW